MTMDRFHPIPHDRLLASMLDELGHGQILGIPKACFFRPSLEDPFTTTRYGQRLETPIGAAAGPHTQLARNLVAAWLCGGRYLELKTVQILDELTLARPCIDMRDEGYNCEWSQELKLEQSFDEYLHGLLLILALRRKLNFPGSEDGRNPGFIQNMSAGYDLAGITSPAMTHFLDRMARCPEEMAAAAARLSRLCPELAEVNLPDGVSSSLTISTMHGCPPDEIQRIALHFIEDRGLHTTLKLNPTLLGPERLRALLQGLGWDLEVPDAVFAKDLSLEQALPIIRTLSAAARKRGVEFNLKLTNTLPCVNRSALPEAEPQVYCSGRPLHPLAVHVALLLREQMGELQDSRTEHSDGCPPMSFCAGADAFNIPDLLAAGLGPVTTCSDLLKPGGYGRLRQYLGVLRERMAAAGADNLEQWQAQGPGLAAYAQTTATARRYAASAKSHVDVKIPRPLPRMDCFTAPCTAACAAGQDIPAYLGHLAQNRPTAALTTIRATNPPTHHLGLACDALCRKRCTRGNLDVPLRIREAKAAAARLGSSESANLPDQIQATSNTENTAPVVVQGLDARSVSCAGTLIQVGVNVTLLVPENAHLADKASPSQRALLTDIADLIALSRKKTSSAETRSGTLIVLVGAALDQPRSAHVITFDAPLPTGPASLPKAVKMGRESALAYLQSQGFGSPRPASRPEADIATLRLARHVRDFGPYADPDSGSRKVTDDEAMPLEAARCLRCDSLCEVCVTACPNRAIVALPSFPGPIAGGDVHRDPDGKPAIRITETRPLTDCTQIVILADICNTCGNCATFCPSSGAPFSDKPRIHLTRASFEDEQNGYFPATPDRMEILHHGVPASLTRTPQGLRYESRSLTLTLNPDTLEPTSADLPPNSNLADLGPAMEAGLLFTMIMGSPMGLFANE
jgi:ferredoxin